MSGAVSRQHRWRAEPFSDARYLTAHGPAAYGLERSLRIAELSRTFAFSVATVLSVGTLAQRAQAAESGPIVKFVEVEATGLKGGVCNEKGEPLSNVIVKFVGPDGKSQEGRQAVTNTRGVFTIDLPNTTCTLRIDQANLKIEDTQLSKCDGLRVTVQRAPSPSCEPKVLQLNDKKEDVANGGDATPAEQRVRHRKGGDFQLVWDSVNVNKVLVHDRTNRSVVKGTAAGAALFRPTKDTTYELEFIGDPDTDVQRRTVHVDVYGARACPGRCLGLLGIGAAAMGMFFIEDAKADSEYQKYLNADSADEINRLRAKVDEARKWRDIAGVVSLAGFGSGGVWIAKNTMFSLRAQRGAVGVSVSRSF